MERGSNLVCEFFDGVVFHHFPAKQRTVGLHCDGIVAAVRDDRPLLAEWVDLFWEGGGGGLSMWSHVHESVPRSG